MAADLSALRSDALEKGPDPHRGVSMHLDLEMTKKQLEKKVADLEQRIMDLQAQVLALALRTPTYITVPAPAVQPLTIGPNLPSWPTPYIGDWPIAPNITCSGTNTQPKLSQHSQNFS